MAQSDDGRESIGLNGRLKLPSYLASLAIAATRPEEEQDIYRETLREAGKYPSALRSIFFEVLKGAVKEVVWTAFVNYARRIRERDPSLKDVADGVVST